jgi:hypothetical protein
MPHAKSLEQWETRIPDNVHDDGLRFGQSYNAIGLLEEKNFVGNRLKLRAGPRTSSDVPVNASRKLGVVLGVVGLVQVSC